MSSTLTVTSFLLVLPLDQSPMVTLTLLVLSPAQQWAAVRIQSDLESEFLVIAVPPHQWLPLPLLSPAIHGQLPSSTVAPPTIRFVFQGAVFMPTSKRFIGDQGSPGRSHVRPGVKVAPAISQPPRKIMISWMKMFTKMSVGKVSRPPWVRFEIRMQLAA
jgi:hypothetical protein